MSEMRVLVKEPGKEPEIRNIKKTLDGMQAVVGGNIEFLAFNGLTEHQITVYGNEDGKALGLAPNVALPMWTGVYAPDMLVGTIFICGSKNYDDVSLTEAEEKIAREWLAKLPGAKS